MKLELTPKPRRVIFAESNDFCDVRSMVELIILPDVFGEKPCAYIHKVYTDKESQNLGFATKLVKRAVRYSVKCGCHKVFLVCDESLLPFYSNCGLKKDEVGMVKLVTTKG